ncbi:MAG TPA: phospho-sugar mutase [Candidatus Borkfalkia avistercoris]|uniref:phosphoglucomutase (alpha-D-glucose-1,6-bisphosphate-dependent) n=1 Tax=Candidatus Borkfalkia avistercoris TaxID=2838504 RepID=A0A9D2A7I0_9FIRM|nr:phospho-sugar mutase [Candidatus Borkfalkia avistercoris]
MNYKSEYEKWLNNPALNEEGRRELESIAGDEKAIEYRFGAELEFGTAGMRGIIGYGTNMMNVYTVRRATQGLSEYIKSLGAAAMKRGVVISYDTRRKSEEFAKASAGVLAANGIVAYLFSDVHPVPMLSYSVRRLGTIAGIMITASHNPKEYNGYKVYGEDGAQMSPEATAIVVDYIEKIADYFSVKETVSSLIKKVPASVDKSYYKKLTKLTLSPEAVKKVGKTLKLVYTPVHGSGYVPVTTILKKLKINVTVVPEQVKKDTEFSTVEVPNPEFKETLSMGIALAQKINADVVFGTDPDSDRLGVAVKDGKGEFVALSGNQVGILLLDYILTRLKEDGKLPANGVVVKSFVTTGMAKAICDDFGVELVDVPVGFKFIGEKIKEYEADKSHTFLFGFEESCGYLRGTDGSRDKDAVVASMLCAEMVCYYTYKKQSVYDRLMDIYAHYGYVLDRNVSIKYSGLNAMKEMNAVVDACKTKKAEKFDIYNVVAVRDYSASVRRLSDGSEETLNIPKTNAVYYELENGSFICVRPSGTEPKLKIYYSVRAKDEEAAEKAYEKMKTAFESFLK